MDNRKRLLHPRHRLHLCPEPALKARQGAQPWGSGVQALPGSALGAAGGPRKRSAQGVMDAPSGAIYAGRRGAAPRTRDLQVSSVLVSMLA